MTDLKYKPPYLGVAYYPEDWDESEIEKDAAMMKKAGINVARIAEFAWSKMEKTEGVYTFDWIHKVVDTLAKYGIATVLGTPTATPPVWLGKKYPDIMFEQENGRRRQHGGRRHCCSNNPHYIGYSAKIVEEMAKEFADDENVIGWQIDNEIYSFGMGCFCPVCAEKFKARLKTKYGTIENLNKSWNLGVFSQEYSDFDEIPTPRDVWLNPHHKLEWLTFQQDSIVDFVTMQAEILKKYIKVPIGTDIMPINGMNYPALNKKLDVMQFNHYNNPEDLWTVAIWYDFIRTIKDRPFWNTETSTCWNGSETITQTVKPEGFCYANSWLPMVLGGEANMYWLWRTHWAGHEIMHGSVLDASGRPMHIFGEVQKTASDFAKAADFLHGTKVDTDIAIHFPSRSWNMFQTQGIVKGFAYASTVVHNFYRPLTHLCLRPDVIESDHAIDKYKLIFSPFVMSLEDNDLGNRMKKWVENGGVWVVGPMTDVRNNEGARFKDRPLGMLEEFLGVKWDYSLPDINNTIKCTWNDGGAFTGSLWYELYEKDGDSLAEVSEAVHSALVGKSVICRKKIGKGYVYLLGAIPSYNDVRERIIPMALADAGIEKCGGVSETYMVAKRSGDNKEGFAIVEFAGKGGEFELPYKAHDLISGKILEGKTAIEPYSVLILEKI